MGAIARAFDALDNAVTDARVRTAEHRKARKFAAGVKVGDTLYATETHRMPWGGTQPLVHEYTVGRGLRIGHLSIEGWYLTVGNPSKEKPHGVQTLAEYGAQWKDGELAENAGTNWGQKMPLRAKAGVR